MDFFTFAILYILSASVNITHIKSKLESFNMSSLRYQYGELTYYMKNDNQPCPSFRHKKAQIDY